MVVTEKIAVILSAVALVTGANAVQADASTTSRPAVVQSQRSSGHWGPHKHSPTKYWPTKDFVPTGRHLYGRAKCSNGGDGTRYRVQLVRTKDKHVRATSSWYFCGGTYHGTSVTVRPGEAYYMRISLKGKAHTIEAYASWS
ncbi:hypothetical protein GCM10023074_13060 [Microbispora amethystogenes]|uniref:Secreted protein n=1 Tax=Microbispora amethystogenes TaxID=1427754 RepID=A0ABQ4F863_9ACTN|nr:hypothetical protein Mam01_11330 [Microbispora amethystogenes]